MTSPEPRELSSCGAVDGPNEATPATACDKLPGTNTHDVHCRPAHRCDSIHPVNSTTYCPYLLIAAVFPTRAS